MAGEVGSLGNLHTAGQPSQQQQGNGHSGAVPF